jgi:ankyrin repeat protein
MMCSHVDVVNLLLQHGAGINQTNNNGESPLHICCTTNLGTLEDRLKIATLLLSQKKINLTAVDSQGREPLSCTKSIQLCNLIKNSLQVTLSRQQMPFASSAKPLIQPFINSE